jgi:hypothetical protein
MARRILHNSGAVIRATYKYHRLKLVSPIDQAYQICFPRSIHTLTVLGFFAIGYSEFRRKNECSGPPPII